MSKQQADEHYFILPSLYVLGRIKKS